MNIVYTSPNSVKESLNQEYKLTNIKEKAVMAGASDTAAELLKKTDEVKSVAALLNPTDRVEISQDARALLAAEENSGEQGQQGAGKTPVNGQPLNKAENEGSESSVDKLRKQLKEAEKKLKEAQQELARVASEAQNSEDPSAASAAQAEVQSLNQQVVALASEVQTLMSMLQEAQQAESQAKVAAVMGE